MNAIYASELHSTALIVFLSPGEVYSVLSDTSELVMVMAASGPAFLLLPPLRKYRKTLAL